MPTPIAVDRLVTGVLEDVAAREAKVSFQDIKAKSRSMEPPRDAKAALLTNGCSVITEFKRAVPYLGEIARLDNPERMARLAQDFQEAGVVMMACQTDRRRFRGSLDDMRLIRAATEVPMICRDIIVDPYQIHEARCFGADVVPLQVALLEQARLEALLDRIESLGMVALLEIRSSQDADRAMQAGGTVVGINAWSLSSDAIDRGVFAEIVPGLPESLLRIAVGGVENPRNLLGYASQGADAVMVGESVMSAQDPTALARSLVAAGKHPACPSRKTP
ncbi:indole-3-glycerol phosphate synthase TrpC [Corynebacterium sp. 32222D000AT]|uniref:indole-3-glycerol phosphate synthase TrpC n=1 Tax=unclassified Corynebacterium TaxID=2624378 RepID=UPI002A9E5335|nr:indole-3-glycerol phosphate synthase TrpC [Mycobacteriaceae bacterium]MDY5828452.1 indole-3-glycerol phosphate synthase TrpC [Corynebacterium sp.]